MGLASEMEVHVHCFSIADSSATTISIHAGCGDPHARWHATVLSVS